MDSDCEGAAALADDSGHFSCTSDEGGGDPGQKQEPMFLVRQELLRSRSEVERLLKSEQWYKQELKSQKHSRLETLERLYAQERKYLMENQRLQQESMRLHTKCAALEKQQEQESPRSPCTSSLKEDSESPDSSFEAKQQEARLRDQRQLIDVLRKQKKMLLDDIQRLSLEHDEKLSQLQQTLAGMELESKHVTGKCKQLLDLKSQMEHQLELRSTALRSVTAEREQLRQVIAELNETLQTQEQLLTLKEQEFLDLKHYYQQKLTRESSIEIMHSYSLKFHEEINSKTSEIASLKNSLNELQTELMMMSQLKEQSEEQQRQLEQLEFTLQAQLLEEAQLRQSDALKQEQVENLTISLASLQIEKEGLKENLKEAQCTLKKLEQKVHSLPGQYAEMCSKCEETRLQLELEKIEIGKLKQKSSLKESDLIEKLQDYAGQCDELRRALAKAEARLDVQSKSAEVWQEKLETIERTDELQTLQKLSLAKDEENRLELQLLKETFQKNLEYHSADSINLQRLQSQYLEQTLAAERASFEASDSGKSTANTTPQEPAHEVANLIDDYKKIVQQTANETCRPRNSFIMELIERSQQCQPNLCQLSEGLAACSSEMEELSRLLVAGRDQRRVEVIPSLMEELRAVAEHT
ncbi:hypothetical protein M5D96_009422 [Drosophila gunungcola]|uniref:Early endosome antigen 1 n=1 Tax=Drosophila gunungcola TaxID=103775 RepID=A0A9P9YJF7_9MUSC|nr:hypothetical protein M5D96_009422 [Drosophila gunungcola]